MALEYIDGAAGLEYGVPNEEDFAKIINVSTTPVNPKRLTRNAAGKVDGFIVGHDPSVVLRLTGEVKLPGGSRPGQEGANTSLLSADFKTDIAADLTNPVNNSGIHAFTTGGVFNGITVTEWSIDDIEYVSDREGVMTFSATATGWEDVQLPAPGP